ncbi:MAG: SDR family oxidoreductase, partial [Planctomycetes bacterium]|nr:SDR family oxidoreductase [Planctomycetota bacterium]
MATAPSPTSPVDGAAPVAIVSGGSRGLGHAVVERLLERGDRVATFSRGRSGRLDDLASRHPERLFTATLDAGDPIAVASFVGATIARFGRIDSCVANAAIAAEGVLATMPDTTIAELLAVNVQGSIVLVRECVRQWLVQPRSGTTDGAGSAVLVSSSVAARGSPGLAVYAATKGALEAFARSLAREVGSRGIRVNSVAPGFLETDLSASLSVGDRARLVRRTPLGRLGMPEDVVGAIDFLTDSRSAFITGQTITVD